MFLLVSVLNMMSYIQKVSSFKATVLMPLITTTTNFMSDGFYEGPKKTPPVTTPLVTPPRSTRPSSRGADSISPRIARQRGRSRPSTNHKSLKPQKWLIRVCSILGQRNPLRPSLSISHQPPQKRLIRVGSIWGQINPLSLHQHRPSTYHQQLQLLQLLQLQQLESRCLR